MKSIVYLKWSLLPSSLQRTTSLLLLSTSGSARSTPIWNKSRSYVHTVTLNYDKEPAKQSLELTINILINNLVWITGYNKALFNQYNCKTLQRDLSFSYHPVLPPDLLAAIAIMLCLLLLASLLSWPMHVKECESQGLAVYTSLDKTCANVPISTAMTHDIVHSCMGIFFRHVNKE